MSRIVKVTLEFEDSIRIADGDEATKFEENLHELVVHANEHKLDPFENNQIVWKTYKIQEPKK